VDPLISILRSWSLLSGGQVLSSLISLATMVLVSRSLGDAEFGRLYLAWTLTLIVGVVVDLGLSQVVARAVARSPALSAPYLRRAAILLGSLGVCLYVALVGATNVLGFAPEIQWLALILGVRMIAEAYAQLLSAFFQAHERMLVPSLARVVGSAVTFALVVLMLARGDGPGAVAIAMVVGAAVRVVLQAVAVRGLSGFKMPASPPPAWRALIREGLPFMGSGALAMLNFRIDVVILGMMVNEETIGWYGAASRAVDAFNFIPLVLTAATFPVLSRLWVAARADFDATARNTLALLLIITIPLAVTLLTLADGIVDFLFTLKSYAPAVPIVQIDAVNLMLMFVDTLLACVLMAVGRERAWIAIIGAACLINSALDWTLIPVADQAYQNGGIGAALAKLVTEVFVLVVALRAIPTGVFGRESGRTAIRVMALGGLLAAVLIGSRSLGVPWILAAFVGGAGYLAAAMWFGLIPIRLLSWFRQLVTRRPRPVVADAA
jgi:O-antigen/teichoic acid export membrane protein